MSVLDGFKDVTKIAFLDKDINTDEKQIMDFLIQKEANEKTAVCIDLSCINSNFVPGVSEPSSVFGLTDQQLNSTLKTLTDLDHDNLIIISEYNPAIEKFKTGEFMLNAFAQVL